MKRYIIMLAFASGCYDTDNGLCIDLWNGGDACWDDTEGDPDMVDMPTLENVSPCPAIGDMVGTPLKYSSIEDDAFFPDFVPGSGPTMSWDPGLLSDRWEWSGSSPSIGEHAILTGAGLGGQLYVHMDPGHGPYVYLLTEGSVSSVIHQRVADPNKDSVAAVSMPALAGQKLWYAPSFGTPPLLPLDTDHTRWILGDEGGVFPEVYGVVFPENQSVLAGPSGGNVDWTVEGGVSFFPAQGYCDFDAAADSTG